LPYAKIEPSGCGEFHGNTKVRIDFFLSPGDYLYDDPSRFYVPDWESPEAKKGYKGALDAEGNPKDPAKYKAWVDGLPHIWLEKRKFHSHFLYFDPDVTEAEIEKVANFHLPNFYAAWCAGYANGKGGMRKGWYRGELDEDAKPKDPIRFQRESEGLDTNPKGKKYRSEVRPARYEFLDEPEIFEQRKLQAIGTAEILKASLLSVSPRTLPEGKTFPSTEIDVGSAAINRGSFTAISSRTIFSGGNPANDTGVIDTVDAYWFSVSGTNDIWFGSGTLSGSTITVTDSESIGDESSTGLQQYTGLDIDVDSGDLIGVFDKGGSANIDEDTSGGSGRYYSSSTGEWIDPGDYTTYGLAPFQSNMLSLYGTGETSQVDVTVTVPAPDTANVAGVVPGLSLGCILTSPLADTINGAGVAPTLVRDVIFASPLADTIDGAGIAPTVGLGVVIVVPLADTIDGACVVPTLVRDSILTSPLLAADVAGVTPTLVRDRIFTCPLADTIDGACIVPVVGTGVGITVPAPDTVNVAGITPTLVRDAILTSPLADTIDVAGITPTLIRDAIFNCPLADTIDGVVLVPSLSLGTTITVPLVNVDGAVNAPTLILDAVLTAPAPDTIDVAGVTPTLRLDVTLVIPLADTVNAAGIVPTLVRDAIITCPLADTIDIAGITPDVSAIIPILLYLLMGNQSFTLNNRSISLNVIAGNQAFTLNSRSLSLELQDMGQSWTLEDR
jgi:hypothetical protein